MDEQQHIWETALETKMILVPMMTGTDGTENQNKQLETGMSGRVIRKCHQTESNHLDYSAHVRGAHLPI